MQREASATSNESAKAKDSTCQGKKKPHKIPIESYCSNEPETFPKDNSKYCFLHCQKKLSHIHLPFFFNLQKIAS